MSNLLRMDLRRLFKNRSFYIILVVTAVLLIMVTVMAYAVADPEIMDNMEAQGAEITESDRVMSEYIIICHSWILCTKPSEAAFCWL